MKNELKNKDDYIKKLEDKCDSLMNDIKNEKKEVNKFIMEQASKPSIVNNKNYNIQFNNLLNEIAPFNDSNIKSRILKMNTRKIANSNDTINQSFVNNFIDVVKDMTFCTDISRGSLIIKDDEGSSEKITSKKFVLECFKKGNKELIDTCTKVHDFITDNPNIDKFEQVKLRGELCTIITYLKENKLNSMVTNTANQILHDCKNITKSKGNNLMKNVIEETKLYDSLEEIYMKERSDLIEKNPNVFIKSDYPEIDE
jgi:hypothetical protein